jgi:RimJ/RimL family protein N-acetyltransferase
VIDLWPYRWISEARILKRMTLATGTHRSGPAFDTQLADGTPVTIRPIRATDASDLVAFHEALSAETAYKRFFGPHPHLSPDEVRRFTTIDYKDRFALVAVSEGKLVAVGRFDRLAAADSAELAFVVADALQGHGIGTLLLKLLIVEAQERGIRRLQADTLGTNQAMLHVFQSSGFKVTDWKEGVIHVELPILGVS